MNYEEIGKLVVKLPKIKFPEILLKQGVIRYIDTENIDDSNLDNFEITEYGYSILENQKYEPLVSLSFLENYIFLFSKENLQGLCKKSYSPKTKVRQKLETFMKKYKVTEQEILDAVNYYHENSRDLRYSLDAQYFIDKEGGSLLLDTINEIKLGIYTTQDKLYY